MAIVEIIIWVVYVILLYYVVFWLLFLFDKDILPKQKKLKSFPSVTITIPMYNEEGNVKETVKSVFSLDYPKNKLKVFCVNDGSTDNTLKVLKKLQKQYGYEIISQKNKGKYTALNAALIKTTSEYFVCLDADSIVSPDALKSMLADFSNKRIAAVMPRMKVYKPSNWMQRFQHLEYITSIFLKVMMQRQDAIPVAPGPFTVYKTDIIKKIGSFRKGNHVEDMEMAFRIQSHHYLMRQNIDALVYTKAPKTFKAYYNQRIRWYGGTILNCIDYKRMFFNKNFGDFGLIQLPMLLIAGMLTLIAVGTVYILKAKNIYHQIKYLVLTNFDILTLIKNIELVIDPYSLNMLVIFTSLLLVVIALLVIFLSLKLNNEKMDKQFAFTTATFMIVYSTITAFIFMNVFIKILFNRTDKWFK